MSLFPKQMFFFLDHEAVSPLLALKTLFQYLRLIQEGCRFDLDFLSCCTQQSSVASKIVPKVTKADITM